MAGLRGSLADDRCTPYEPDRGPQARGRIWSIILAGGNGTRLMGASVHGHCIDRPKQFLRFGASRSLLRATLQRVRKVTPWERTLAVVAAHHRQWWTGELHDLPGENIVVQPRNRGTTLAILHALIEILRRDLDATVVVHPCDHGVDREPSLLAALDQAIARAAGRPGDLVMIGAVPVHPETEYGWILPEHALREGPMPVRTFQEKPDRRLACQLLKSGGLWNTFLFAVSGLGLLERIFRAVPRIAERYLDRMSATGWKGDALDEFYASTPASDFSHDVLERSDSHLYVVPLHGCEWTDLGTPARLEAWLERTGTRSPAVAVNH